MPGPHKKGPSPGAMEEKPDMKTVKRLLRVIFSCGYTPHLIVVAICIIISAVTGVVASLAIQILIDDYIVPLMGMENPVWEPLIRVLAVMAGIFILGVFASFLYNRLMVIVSQGVLKTVRDKLFSHMQTLPLSYFDTHAHGDLMSHYTNDIDTLRQLISQSMPQAFSSLLTIVFVFCSMIYLSPLLTILVVLILVLMLFISAKITGSSGKYFFRQQQSLGKINGYIEEMIHGQRVVKVFCHEEEAKAGFSQRNEELFENAAAANTYANILMPIMGNIGNLQYVLIAVVGGVLALSGIGGLTLGTIAAFMQLSKSFSNPVAQIAQQLNSIVMALAGGKRIFRLMDEASEGDSGYVTLVKATEGESGVEENSTGEWYWKHPHHDGTLTYEKMRGNVVLDHVDFSYVPGKEVLHDISFYGKEGQKIAFVGATGAGKTTITNLINRFYDIEDGKIRYDGININKIRKSDLRFSLGMVLQETNLFTGTVRENIRYGKLDATDEEVVAAAKLANAHGFISRLPHGYDTMIRSGGDNLSQGQRQLISIARAAVANPPVMILDEATSSIDTHTEFLVQQGMDRLMKGRTVFVIAHRLSTVKDANVILVMENGRIVERGTHEDLIASKGMYYRLYTGSFELE